MAVRRVRRWAVALELLALAWMVCVNQSQAADDEGFSPGSRSTDSTLSDRRIPFYDTADPVVAPREAHAQLISNRAVGAPSTSATSGPPPATREIIGDMQTDGREKTPLPDAEFLDTTESSPADRSRSGFGSSVAWALGILAVGWLARQFLKTGGARTVGIPSAIELLSRESLGPQQQLALVRFGRRILLVGTTPTGMSTLATVDDPAEVQAIVAELRAATSQVGPTLLDLFRTKRTESTRESVTDTISLSTSSRAPSSERRSTPPVNREVADV